MIYGMILSVVFSSIIIGDGRFSSTWIMVLVSCGGKIFPPVSSQKLHEKFCATPKMHDGENLEPFECIFWIPRLWCNCLKTEDL